jgi:hypothetical protein
MNDTSRENQPKPAAQSVKTTENAGDLNRQAPLQQPPRAQPASQQQHVSRFEKFATTQAAGDGVQGDALKPNKSTDEKLGANMADRK